jgi:hypothetical protein
MTHRHRALLSALMAPGLAAALALAGTGSALAQTRAEEIASQQRARAETAKPDVPSKAERFFDQAEQGKWFLGVPRGWYPAFGSIYPGSGLAGGGGYRHYIGYDSFVDVSAMYSIASYKRVRITGSTPNHLHDRLDLSGTIEWLDAAAVPFYGLGNDSELDDRTSFRLNRTQLSGVATLHLVDWLRLSLDGGVDDYTQKAGLGRFRSIGEVFTPDTAPLLGQHLRYVRGEASATVLWLPSPGYSRRGGLVRFGYEEFSPLQGDPDTFGIARTEIVQHVPLLRETWVVSLRGRSESVARPSDVVPYFLMPWLGSGTTLRGYNTGRLRDRHSLLLTSELRWFPNRLGFDMAVFFDAGKVSPTLDGLSLRNMKTDVGIGARFHTPAATALRAELVHGLEGWRMVLTGAAPF